jgi:hypothetical protein
MLFRLSVKCSVHKKPEDHHHVFLAKGHTPDVNSTERQARKMYFYNSKIFLFPLKFDLEKFHCICFLSRLGAFRIQNLQRTPVETACFPIRSTPFLPCYCPVWTKTGKCWQILVKLTNIKLNENPFSHSWVVTLGQTDGRTNRHGEADRRKEERKKRWKEVGNKD